MPNKSLTNRLEDLENEIRVLLTLQEIGTTGCQILKGKSITKHADGNVEQIEFEGSTCPTAKSIAKLPGGCACPKSKPEPEARPPPPPPPPKPPAEKKPKCICTTRKQKKGEGDKSPDQECKDLLEKLQNDMKGLETKLNKTQKEKQNAEKETGELKKNYESLSASSKVEQEELLRLKREREELFEKLEEEATARRRLSEEAKEALAKEQKNLKDKLGKIGVNAAKSAKKNRRHSEELASVVKKRDDHIRRLSDTTDTLMNSISEKEAEAKRLEEAQKETLRNLLDAQHANKALAEQNSMLIKGVKDLQDKLTGEKNCVQKLTKHIEFCKVESCRLKEEVERMKSRLKSAFEGPKEIKRVAKLEDKLRESREREQIWLDEAAVMEARLDELEKSHEKAEINFEDELDRIYRHNKKLQNKYEQALQQIEQIKSDNQKKINEMKEDFDKLVSELKKKNNVLIEKRKKAERDLEAAMVSSLRDRKLAEQMVSKVKQLEVVIQTHQTTIAEKDQKIASVQKQTGLLKDHIAQLDQEANELKNVIEKRDVAAKELNAEMADVKANLEREREETINKEQIIAEHVNRIENLNNSLNNTENKLKSAMDEAKIATEEVRRSKAEIRSLNTKMEEAELKAATATAKAAELAEALAKPKPIPPAPNTGDAAIVPKKDPITPQFERKIQLLERKRELQLELITKQRDQAVYAAKFATQRLLETVSDFQNQTCIHKKIQLLLSHLLQEKEAYIKSMEEKCGPCDLPTGRLKPQPGCGSSYCPNMY